MRWANSYWPLFFVLAGVCAGCHRDDSITVPAGPEVQPIAVAPFEFAPDVVLLITGGTGGMLEICDCPPPMPAGMSRRSGLIASYRAAFGSAVALVDTGDVTHPEPGHRRNAYTHAAYRSLGYDVIALGDMEWSAERADRDALARTQATLLSGTITESGGVSQPVAKLTRNGRSVAFTSVIGDDASWMLSPTRTKTALPRLDDDSLRVGIVHGSGDDVATAATQGGFDLILQGHTERSSVVVQRVDGIPVIRVGGMGYVGVVALKLSDKGRIKKIAYRCESLATRWPVDERMRRLFLQYASPDAARTERTGTPPTLAESHFSCTHAALTHYNLCMIELDDLSNVLETLSARIIAIRDSL
jgi:hypothetical protein